MKIHFIFFISNLCWYLVSVERFGFLFGGYPGQTNKVSSNYNICRYPRYPHIYVLWTLALCSGAVPGKTGKTAVLPRFPKKSINWSFLLNYWIGNEFKSADNFHFYAKGLVINIFKSKAYECVLFFFLFCLFLWSMLELNCRHCAR